MPLYGLNLDGVTILMILIVTIVAVAALTVPVVVSILAAVAIKRDMRDRQRHPSVKETSTGKAAVERKDKKKDDDHG